VHFVGLFFFVFIIENARSKKNKISLKKPTSNFLQNYCT